MPWIKKNLTLVLGGLVGLVLLAGSGFFLFSQLNRESEVDAQLLAKKEEWTALNDRNPFPDDKNIRATKEEAARVQKVAAELRETIRPVPVPEVRDTYGLRLLIETTISELSQEADDAGVNVPDHYAFTFQRLREHAGDFNSNGIPKIAEQVSQVATLCRVLFDAKVHSLDTFRRASVLKEETGSDYLTKKGITNSFGVVRTPYDLSFRSFTTELAAVLNGLAELDQVVVIKTINIEPTSLPRPTRHGPSMTVAPTMTPQVPMQSMGPGGMDPALAARYGLGPRGRSEGGEASPPGGGMSPEMRSRYGLGPGGPGGDLRSRYGGGPGASYTQGQPLLSQPAAPTMMPSVGAPRGPQTVLDEKPLRVILQVDFISLSSKAGAGKSSARPSGTDSAEGDTEAAANDGSSAQ